MSTTPGHRDADAALLRWFADIGLADRPSVGGKGASLGELQRAGISVPAGFVVTTSAFERLLAALEREEPIRKRVASLDANDLPAVTGVCKEIRRRIETSPLPLGLQEAIAEGYRALSAGGSDAASGGDRRSADSPVAIRSSATSEDSAEASFAGLQDTYLWVRGVEGAVHAVRSCWASLYNVESVSYRLRLKMPEDNVAMGVVIQRMVNSQCSGVMFTRSPTTGDRSVIAIEGSWGLGSSIVSGEVTPDKFVVSKVTGEISSRTISEKLVQHLPDHFGGGVRHEPVPDEHQKLPCLTDAQIAELTQIAKRVERHYGSAQDIEWAIAHEERGAYLLQSRPETVWASRESSPVAVPKARAFDHVISLLGGRQR